MRIGFVPDRRNLGGKKDIDNLQKNHLLALINAKSVTNNKIAPFKPIAHQNRQRQKSLGQIQIEFREVYESQKRVLNLKKGGIDNKQPVCFDRKNFIKNRACFAKDIQSQDHKRNVISLSKKINGISQKSEQNIQKMKEEQIRQQNLQSKFHSRHDHSLFQNSDAYSILKIRPQSANPKSGIKGIKKSQKQSIDYSQIELQDVLVPVNYAYKNKSNADLNLKRNQSHLVSMDYSEVFAQENSVNPNIELLKYNDNQKKNYIDSQQDFLISGAPILAKESNFYTYENQLDEDDVEYLYQKNKSENSIQLDEGQLLNDKALQSKQQKPIQKSIPFITVFENNDPYTELRRSLLNVIMDYKLYDKEQMMDLAKMVKKKNPHLDLKQIQAVCRNIVIRLYGEL